MLHNLFQIKHKNNLSYVFKKNLKFLKYFIDKIILITYDNNKYKSKILEINKCYDKK